MPFYHHIRKRAKRVKRERRDLSLRTHCKYTGIKGFLTVYNDAVKYQYILTEKAKYKAKVLVFWGKMVLRLV